jgi:hypothetical protein
MLLWRHIQYCVGKRRDLGLLIERLKSGLNGTRCRNRETDCQCSKCILE